MPVLKTREYPAGTTAVGLLLSLAAPTLYTLVVRPTVFRTGADDLVERLTGLGVMWLLAAAVTAYVVRVEKRPLRSIGFVRPSRAWVLQAFGIGVLLSFLVPVLLQLVSRVIPSSQVGSVEAVTQVPWWLMLFVVITAAVTEEILYRGYPLERLIEWSGRPWLSALISLAFFAVAHAQTWNVTHIVAVVIPIGAALTGLYLWRRNLIVMMITHFMIDLPLVFLAWGSS